MVRGLLLRKKGVERGWRFLKIGYSVRHMMELSALGGS